MLSWCEKLLDPDPDAPPAIAPRGFFAFVWAGTRGARPVIALMTLLTAVTGVFEALAFLPVSDINTLGLCDRLPLPKGGRCRPPVPFFWQNPDSMPARR